MQVTAVSFVPDATQTRQWAGKTAVRNQEITVPPAEFKPRAQTNTDVLAIGNGSGSEDLRAAQADWGRIQAGKAASEAKRDEETAEQNSNTVMANDLAMIALAAQSGNAIAVLAAQQRLAQHVLKL